MYNKEFSQIYDFMGWDSFSKDVFGDIKKLVKNKGSVLDIACGTGELSNLFFKDGYNVVGFDKSEEMVKMAKKKNRKIDFFIDDMESFDLNKKFDLITCLYDSVNHIKDWKSFFKRVNKHLSDDGIFVFDYNTVEGLKNWGNIYKNEDEKGFLFMSGKYDSDKLSAELNIDCFVKDKKGNKFLHIKDGFGSYTYPNSRVRFWLKDSGLSFKLLYPNSKNKKRVFLVCKKKK